MKFYTFSLSITTADIIRVTDYSDNFFGIFVSQRFAGYEFLNSDITSVLTEPVLLSKPDLHSFAFWAS
ncbi:MAG: hypothetical protein ACPL5F_13575, partial [Moorellaceae bacterium]